MDPKDSIVVDCSALRGNPLGLTKREYFAAMAMQGFITKESPHTTFWEIADVSVKMADTIIEELSKENK